MSKQQQASGCHIATATICNEAICSDLQWLARLIVCTLVLTDRNLYPSAEGPSAQIQAAADPALCSMIALFMACIM